MNGTRGEGGVKGPKGESGIHGLKVSIPLNCQYNLAPCNDKTCCENSQCIICT